LRRDEGAAFQRAFRRLQVCGTEVHARSGYYDFFAWKVDKPDTRDFGKRWAAPR
jgi:hypothetical protein